MDLLEAMPAKLVENMATAADAAIGDDDVLRFLRGGAMRAKARNAIEGAARAWR